jgi:hypothetical protein
VQLWGADSLDALLQRDFKEGTTKATAKSMTNWLERFYQGETIPNKWTFHPNKGKDGPKNCDITSSGIFVNSKTSKGEPTGEPRLCMLVVVENIIDGEKATKPEDATTMRRTEMLRNFPVIARLFNMKGELVDQNPEAEAVFGCRSNVKAAESITSSTNSKHHRRSPSGSLQAYLSKNKQENNLTCTSDRSEATNATCMLSDFLSQFVDLDVGRQVWKEVTENSEFSTETLLYTTRLGQSWFSVDVRESWDPVSSERLIVFSARDISKLIEYAKEQADKQNHARNEFFAVMVSW